MKPHHQLPIDFLPGILEGGMVTITPRSQRRSRTSVLAERTTLRIDDTIFSGYHWCNRCNKVVEPDYDPDQHCPVCGSRRLKYFPPV